MLEMRVCVRAERVQLVLFHLHLIEINGELTIPINQFQAESWTCIGAVPRTWRHPVQKRYLISIRMEFHFYY